MRHSSRWLIGMTAALVLLLSPAWALANRLEIPGNGATVSGIGVISGWKCEAEGDITVSFDGGDPIPLVYGSERGDTSAQCVMMMGSTALWPSGTGGYSVMGNIPPSSMTTGSSLPAARLAW